MPIQYQDPLYATLTAELAQNVAFKQQAETEAKNRQQMDLAAMEIQSRRELAQFEAQMRTQAAKLSQAWELEKMQRESELDFQDSQKKLQLARDAVTIKEARAKEQYMAYVDNIDQDKTLGDKEKGQFKRMAYDQMVAGINLADQVYFPEKYAAGHTNQGGISIDEQGNVTFGGTTQPTTPAVPTQPKPAAPVSELRTAAIQAAKDMPGATIPEIEVRAEQLAKETIAGRYMTQFQEEGRQMSLADMEAEANRLAAIEVGVQLGFEKSKKLGYKPTGYQQFEEVMQALPSAASRAAGTVFRADSDALRTAASRTAGALYKTAKPVAAAGEALRGRVYKTSKWLRQPPDIQPAVTQIRASMARDKSKLSVGETLRVGAYKAVTSVKKLLSSSLYESRQALEKATNQEQLQSLEREINNVLSKRRPTQKERKRWLKILNKFRASNARQERFKRDMRGLVRSYGD